jgi:hypothetical protein
MKKEEKLKWEREGETKNEYEGATAVMCGCVRENGERTLVLMFYQSLKVDWAGFILGHIKNLDLDPNMYTIPIYIYIY